MGVSGDRAGGEKTGGEWLFTKYRKSFVRGLQNAVETYARDVDQSDYYDGYDVNTAIEESTFYNGEALECDFSSVALSGRNTSAKTFIMRSWGL